MAVKRSPPVDVQRTNLLAALFSATHGAAPIRSVINETTAQVAARFAHYMPLQSASNAPNDIVHAPTVELCRVLFDAGKEMIFAD